MTFVSVTNILLCLLCVGVLVQSARMLRSFRTVRTSDLGETVKQLDRATDQARQVLSDLRRVLATEGQASAHGLSVAEALRDELSLMVGIGNAVAERLAEAAQAVKVAPIKGNRTKTVEAETAADGNPSTHTRAKRSRGGRPRGQQNAVKVPTAEKLKSKVRSAVSGKGKKVMAGGSDTPLLTAIAVQPKASVSVLPRLSKAA